MYVRDSACVGVLAPKSPVGVFNLVTLARVKVYSKLCI